MDMSVALRVARRFITLPLDKRKLYLAKMQEEGVTPANLPIPEVASAFERIPLSYAQERQWFLWQMDPQSAAYNIPSALRLRGELDVEALSASLGAIVERHQSLRTVFVEDEQLDGFRRRCWRRSTYPSRLRWRATTTRRRRFALSLKARRNSPSICVTVRCFARACCAWRPTITC